MSLYAELTDQPLNVLIDYWFGEPIDGPEYTDTFFEEVTYEIARHGSAGAEFLTEQLTSDGQDRIHCLIGGLSVSDLPLELRKDLIRPFLSCPKPAERSEAVAAFCHFRDPTVRSPIEPNLDDEDIAVRVQALTYMGKVFPLDSLDLLVASLDDPIWNIRATAIDEIDELEDEGFAASVMDQLWRFLDDSHRYVRDAASWYFMTSLWWDGGIEDIRERIARETDPHRIATLVRFAGDQRRLDIVLGHVNDPHPTVRLAALDELRQPRGSVLAAIEQDPRFFESCERDPDKRVQDLLPLLKEHLDWERKYRHDNKSDS